MGCLVLSGDVWWKFHSAGTLLCLPRELDPIAGIAFEYPHCTLGPLWVPLVPFSRWLWFHFSYLFHFLPPRYTKWTPRGSSTPTRERTCTAFGPLTVHASGLWSLCRNSLRFACIGSVAKATEAKPKKAKNTRRPSKSAEAKGTNAKAANAK